MLTLELLPAILDAADSSGDVRIIFVSSNSHQFVSWDPENFSPPKEGYHRLKTYALTKLYNVREEREEREMGEGWRGERKKKGRERGGVRKKYAINITLFVKAVSRCCDVCKFVTNID